MARARWVVDASGVDRIMAHRRKWVILNDAHPIASIWIPLQGRDMSVGIVWDERFTDAAAGDSLAYRLRLHLEQHPLGKLLLEQAEMVEDDLHCRKHLAWRSERMVGDGLCLVGDAAAFMDPFYSPGMDWISFGVSASVNLIRQHWQGEEAIADRAEQLNQHLTESYVRWFEAIYRDKYSYMADFDLMTLAFRLDLGLYYFGVVSQPYKHGELGLLQPPFTGPHTAIPFKVIRFYNRRLARIAEARKRRGVWGEAQHRAQFFVQHLPDGPDFACSAPGCGCILPQTGAD